jgi:twitching motility protein PilI
MLKLMDNMLSADDAMAMLDDIEQRSLEAARRLPESSVETDTWAGLVFSVAGVRVVAAMREVSEMLAYPDKITRVPGSKPWVLGLANVRGSLLPIIDLQVYFGAKALVPSKSSRILVLRLRGLVTGLLVPSVQGMRHFGLKDHVANARMKGALGAYVYEAFNIEGQVWPVFSMSALAADPNFRSAAV